MRKLTLGVAALAAATLALGSVAKAATPAVSLLQTSGGQDVGGGTLDGWSFTVNKAITVTSLGIYDSGEDGLNESHDVGLWVLGLPGLLASADIASGTSDPLTNQFRYHAVTPLTLTPGVEYVIGALYIASLDPILYSGTVTTNPLVNYVSSRFEGGQSPGPFGQNSAGPPNPYIPGFNGFYGPNFQFSGGAPEPATWALMLLGFGTAGAALRRRRAALA